MDYRFDFTDEIGDKVITVPTGVIPKIYYDTNWTNSLSGTGASLYPYIVNADGTETLESSTIYQSTYLSDYYYFVPTKATIENIYSLSPVNRYKIVCEVWTSSDEGRQTIASKQMYVRVQYRNINEYDVYTGTEYKQ